MSKANQNAVQKKLKSHRDQNEGMATFTLPETDIKVEFPRFRRHGDWQKCLRVAKNKIGEAQAMYVCRIATFDGEKITVTDWNAYMPLSDANDLLAEVFGDDEDDDWGDEEDLGNDQTTKA